MAESRALQQGLVVAGHGRHCWVEDAHGVRRLCHPRGKKNQVVVGDRVLWQPAPGQGQEGSIEEVLPRRNLLYRQDELRSKSFAANLDQVLILIAAEPVFSESQLARALIAAEAAQIRPLIVLNKSDLAEPFASHLGSGCCRIVTIERPGCAAGERAALPCAAAVARHAIARGCARLADAVSAGPHHARARPLGRGQEHAREPARARRARAHG